MNDYTVVSIERELRCCFECGSEDVEVRSKKAKDHRKCRTQLRLEEEWDVFYIVCNDCNYETAPAWREYDNLVHRWNHNAPERPPTIKEIVLSSMPCLILFVGIILILPLLVKFILQGVDTSHLAFFTGGITAGLIFSLVSHYFLHECN